MHADTVSRPGRLGTRWACCLLCKHSQPLVHIKGSGMAQDCRKRNSLGYFSLGERALDRVNEHYNLLGLVGVALFFCAAYTPSLVPRPWYYQGIVSGITANLGYCAGVFLTGVAAFIREFLRDPHAHRRIIREASSPVGSCGYDAGDTRRPRCCSGFPAVANQPCP